VEALEQEHEALERRPFDRAEHDHLRHLAEKKADLRAHLVRLK
jgi:hypothetical protein